MDNVIIEGLGSNYLKPSFRLFFFFLFWSKLTELLNVTFTSVTEHCSILSFIDFLLCLFSLGGGWRGKRQGQKC